MTVASRALNIVRFHSRLLLRNEKTNKKKSLTIYFQRRHRSADAGDVRNETIPPPYYRFVVIT